MLIDVMSVVAKVVNSILSRSLHHHQFQTLMDEVNKHYGNLLYFSEVVGPCCYVCVCDLQRRIGNFLHQKNLPYANQFSGPRWFTRVALFMDSTVHLNDCIVEL